MRNNNNTAQLRNTDDGDALAIALRKWQRLENMLARGVNFVAYGPAGTGKTTTIMNAHLNGRDCYRIAANDELTADDIFGRPGIKNGSTCIDYGTLAIALQRGDRVLIDDIQRGSESLYSALFNGGDRKSFALADGTVVNPGPTSQLVLAMNGSFHDLFPHGHGVRDRFRAVFIPEPCEAALQSLDALLRNTARRAVRYEVTGFRAWQHFEEELRAEGMSVRDALANGDENGVRAYVSPESPIPVQVQALALPSAIERENTIIECAETSFGPRGHEIVESWRVAAAEDIERCGETFPTANGPANDDEREMFDAYTRGVNETTRVFEQLAAQAESRGGGRGYTAIQVIVSKDETNGTPRRVVVAYDNDGDIVWRSPIGRGGHNDSLPNVFADIPQLPDFYVPVSTYDAINERAYAVNGNKTTQEFV